MGKVRTEGNMAEKWHEVGAATIVKDKKKSLQEVAGEAATLALQAWRRGHQEEPDAVFMRDPFAEKWNGLPVIEEPEVPAGAVYVGVMG